MSSFCSHHRSRVRPWLAMVVAYAVALQALLTGFAPTALPLADDIHAVICFGNGDQADAPDGAPATHASHAQCCVLCGAFRVAAPPPTAVIIRLAIVTSIEFPPSAAAPIVLPRHISPRQSQGPPRAA